MFCGEFNLLLVARARNCATGSQPEGKTRVTVNSSPHQQEATCHQRPRKVESVLMLLCVHYLCLVDTVEIPSGLMPPSYADVTNVDVTCVTTYSVDLL